MKVFAGKIINSDGTYFNPPIHPEIRKIQDRYPMCQSWCHESMYCDKCPLRNAEPADEEEERILREHSELVSKYILEHNPDMETLIDHNRK